LEEVDPSIATYFPGLAGFSKPFMLS
jgi:hypothetical protein